MNDPITEPTLCFHHHPALEGGTLLLAFDGWMDGGEVSTGTVRRLVSLLQAVPFADIDPDPFYVFHVPGPMELNALIRPRVKIDDGRVVSLEMPSNTFSSHEPARLAFFLGKEPQLRWRAFGDAVFDLARKVGLRRILFVGSFGGPVPHTREPRLYVTASDERLLNELAPFGLRRTGYEGPGSFTSYLLTRGPEAGMEVGSLVVEIPGYLQGRNPMSIEAVTRRLAKALQLPLDLQTLRVESTEWELTISSVVERDKKMAQMVRELESAYDDDLLKQGEI